jgi:hypothetical protein
MDGQLGHILSKKTEITTPKYCCKFFVAEVH